MRRLFILTVTLGLNLGGCASSELDKKETQKEIVQQDVNMAEKLTQAFESTVSFRQMEALSEHMLQLTNSLMASSGNHFSGKVRLVASGPQKKWTDFGLPPDRIYLSVEMLKQIEFENEAAALVAVQLGHLLKNHLLLNLEKNLKSPSSEEKPISPEPVDIKFLEKAISAMGNTEVKANLKEAFKFSEAEEIEAMQSAVNLLYKSGFDSRGLVSLYKKHLENETYSPYSPAVLKSLMARTRKEIAFYAPLRNPYVRSEKFLILKKRIEDL